MVLETRLIRHALALAHYRNFARAARALHLTQPSLSRSIASLERELGVRLFDRGRKGVRPTAFGELLLERGKALLEGEADLRREIALLSGLETGRLRIGAAPYPAEISIGSAVARLLIRHPRVQVEVLCAEYVDIARRLLAGNFDVGVCALDDIPDATPLRREALPQHPLVLACRPGHPLATRKGPSVAEVLAFPLATTALGGAQARAAATGATGGRMQEEGGVFVPAVRTDTLSVARAVARGSDALFPATVRMIAPDLSSGTLAMLDFRVPELATRYGIVTVADRSPAPVVAAFLEVLREVEAEVAAAEVVQPASGPRRTVAAPRRRSLD